MTALTQYERLEAPGLWRQYDGAQRQNVIVSVGDATLTITDMHDQPLAHWSLPAVIRLNPGKRPALFAPSDDPQETEQIEIDDADMIEAIAKVRRVIDRAQPRPGRLRIILSVLLAVGLGTLSVTWLPGALRNHTVSVLPDATRIAVGERLFTQIQHLTGAPCTAALGNMALARLDQRVLGPGARKIVVLSSSGIQAGHLPGGITLLNRALVEDFEEPDVAAGFILAEAQRRSDLDPMLALLQNASLLATARLLTSGHISDAVLAAHAERLFTTPPADVSPDILLARFAEARVRSTPYAYALDQTGETTLPLIEADPVPLAQAEPLLADGDWVALQNICLD